MNNIGSTGAILKHTHTQKKHVCSMHFLIVQAAYRLYCYQRAFIHLFIICDGKSEFDPSEIILICWWNLYYYYQY